MIWIISANGKVYDYASAFQKWGYVDWHQKVNFNEGDIVYVYCTKPYQKIMYKTEVIKKDMLFSQCQDDREFWKKIDNYEISQSGKYARLKLIAQVDTENLALDKLMQNGLKAAPQGPVKVNDVLNEYIQKFFDDYYTEGFFNDIQDTEDCYEGHCKTVQVNIYERSSIARQKCIEYHGCTCMICGMDFEKVYGEVGKGFIHVHHIVPLYTIGKDYCVDYKNDLIPVCPNCHAMIHRKENGEYLSLEELKMRLSKR